jgi:predicted amidophosphoribosyltransferase
MSESSIPDESGRVKMFWGVSAHLAFVPTPRVAVCPYCRRGAPYADPACERCGQSFHLECYVAALPAGAERDFFALSQDPYPPYLGIFLCGGCRS